MAYAELKAKRKKYRISQTKLAEASGYSKAAISAWELEKDAPSERELSRLNDALSGIIKNIEDGVFDVRKKRITRSEKEKRPLPAPVRNAAEYGRRLSMRGNERRVPYAECLSDLFRCAQSPKDADAPKAIALFSGCGGLSLGFAAEGFRLIGHVEIDDAANQIYEANFPDSKRLGKDIRAISDKELRQWLSDYGEIDVVIGGPPCQGFSLAGKRDPEDMRSQLYQNYAHIVSALQPKAFVMENVRLLTSMKNADGKLFIDCIWEAFSKAGYNVVRREVNACDYGVPQSRERVFLIGLRRDIRRDFTFPVGAFADKEKLTFRDAASDLPPLESGETSADPLHWSVAHPAHVIAWLKDVPEGHSAHENENPSMRPPSGFNTTYKRIRWDEPCSTISTNFNMISGCRNVHPVSTRSLTIREAARAQSFPDEFAFVGKWGGVRKAIGNAVPPILSAALAKAVYEQLLRN